MGKKRDKANENIRMLIDELVDEKKSALNSDCPYWHTTRPCLRHENDCDSCKEDWKEQMREHLEKKYIVN